MSGSREASEMCDIVDLPCKVCGKILPMHLGDYMTDRKEIEVYCDEHITKCSDQRVFFFKSYVDGVGMLMGIRDLTDNAKEHTELNFPNTAEEWNEVRM